eukprot:TRINITY_DN4646_c0_g2_i9.p1 TRINITY_DN4646_c0_g2~~TRINITY_DN4646_c0_g2_i9.p1  ORF type:complete len:231 (+),score=27.37 TRINITY_DN4646_c0_g2_i9:91-783(+)
MIGYLLRRNQEIGRICSLAGRGFCYQLKKWNPPKQMTVDKTQLMYHLKNKPAYDAITTYWQTNEFKIIYEGSATCYIPQLKDADNTFILSHFYNEGNCEHRNFTLLVYQTYINELPKDQKCRILLVYDTIGMTTIRMMKELDTSNIEKIIVNDTKPHFQEIAKLNFEINEVNKKKIEISMEDPSSIAFNASPDQLFDIIDIDPRVSSLNYINALLLGLKDGGRSLKYFAK